MRQTITITLACPPQKLKPNVRSHHMAKANATRQYRAHAANAATDEIERLRGLLEKWYSEKTVKEYVEIQKEVSDD